MRPLPEIATDEIALPAESATGEVAFPEATGEVAAREATGEVAPSAPPATAGAANPGAAVGVTSPQPDGARFVPVARVGDVPPGWVARVRVGPRRIALANCDGDWHALDDACSHAGGPLGDNRLYEGCLLTCPWHEAVFDVRSGEVRAGPARKPQRTYPVRVEDGLVLIALD